MKHIFHLQSCSSCRRIIKDVNPGSDFTLQNLKEQGISSEQLDNLAELLGSYEILFNKQSRKYRELELYNKVLSENDYRDWILKEYTFLKRPIFVIDSKVFICRNKEVVNSLKAMIK